MKKDGKAPDYSEPEEILNSITHGFGILLAVVATVLLVVFAAMKGTAVHIIGCSVFGVSAIILYTASTLYHSFRSPRIKSFFRMLDHTAIFLLIAGTYTPFTLVTLKGPWGWSVFGVIWGLALAGIVLKTILSDNVPALFLAIYLALGWTVIVAIKPLISSLLPGGLVLLVAGGLSYTFGVFFYSWEKLPFNHAVWHIFVIAGSVFHFFAIFFYVIPHTG